ncbi:unnamed protein product, partial [Amoebophrya sp. A25]
MLDRNSTAAQERQELLNQYASSSADQQTQSRTINFNPSFSKEISMKQPAGIEIGQYCHKVTLHCESLTKYSFVATRPGFVRLTYPIRAASRFASLSVLRKSNLEETDFIIGKSYTATVNLVPLFFSRAGRATSAATNVKALAMNQGADEDKRAADIEEKKRVDIKGAGNDMISGEQPDEKALVRSAQAPSSGRQKKNLMDGILARLSVEQRAILTRFHSWYQPGVMDALSSSSSSTTALTAAGDREQQATT